MGILLLIVDTKNSTNFSSSCCQVPYDLADSTVYILLLNISVELIHVNRIETFSSFPRRNLMEGLLSR